MTESSETRDRLLQAVWEEIRGLTPANVTNFPAAARAIAGGASPDDLVAAMTHHGYEVAFGLLFLLGAEHAERANYDATVGWSLVEVTLHDDGRVEPRDIGALDFVHESLLGSDPTGREGQDFLS